jgi:hypothetical protein
MQQMNYIIIIGAILAITIIGLVFWGLARATKDEPPGPDEEGKR